MKAPGRLAPLLLALLPASGPALANTVTDAPSGTTVVAPAGYEATALQEADGRTTLQVSRMPGSDAVCRITFTPTPQDVRRSQADMNHMIEGAPWQTAYKLFLATRYAIDSTALTRTRGITGFLVVGDDQPKDGKPAWRVWLVTELRPVGRTVIACATQAAGFDDRVAEFWDLLDGTRLQ